MSVIAAEVVGAIAPKSTNPMTNQIITITSGGIASKAIGGSFASGAISAAFVQLFNHQQGNPNHPNNADNLFWEGEHHYQVTSEEYCVNGINSCSVSNVASKIQEVGGFPNQSGPVIDNGTWQNFDAGRIMHYSSNPILSIATSEGVVNVTQPGHIFYPGSVIRDAVLINNNVHIRTQGYGLGRYGKPNNWGRGIWNGIDSKVFNRF